MQAITTVAYQAKLYQAHLSLKCEMKTVRQHEAISITFAAVAGDATLRLTEITTDENG